LTFYETINFDSPELSVSKFCLIHYIPFITKEKKMNLKIKKIMAVSIVLMLSWVVVDLAVAQTPCPMNNEAGGRCRGMGSEGGGPMGCPGFCQGISGISLKQIMAMDLTDEQKTKVANVLAAHQEESRQLADSLAGARQTFVDVLNSEKAGDEAAVRQAFRQMSEIMENQVVVKTKIIAGLKPVLSQGQLMDLTDHPSKKSGDQKPMNHMKKQGDVQREMMDTWIRTYADAPGAKE